MEIIAYGEPVMDVIISVDRMPGSDDQSVQSQKASWQYGGKVSTALAAAARLGRKTGLVAEIAGLVGEYIRRDHQWHGIDTSHLIRREKGESWMGLCLADSGTGGRAFIRMNPEQYRRLEGIMPEELDREYMTSGKYLLLSLGDEASRVSAAWCREAGVQTVMDADDYHPGIDDMLHLLDHFIPSEYYYRHVFGDSRDYEGNLLALRAKQKNPNAVTILTLGERGLAGYDEDGHYFTLPAYKVDVVDTTGAGDVFHGAYIAGKLEGMDTVEACRFASAAAAIKCTRLGGRAALATMDVVLEYMKSGHIDYAEIDQRVKRYATMPFQS